MKKKYSPLAIILLFAFVFGSQLASYAQDKVNGNGNVTTEEHDVGSFDALKLGGVFNVILHQGSKENVKVIADENLHDLVRIEKNGNVLEIDTKPRINIGKKKKLEIHVTIRDLKKMKLGGVGNVVTENPLRLDDLELIVSSVGNIELALECNKLVADLNAVGNVELSGKIKNADIENRGVGKLAAFDLKAQTLALDVSGVGGTEVHAEKELSIEASGVGSVHYKGNAVITNLKKSGIGKIKKID